LQIKARRQAAAHVQIKAALYSAWKDTPAREEDLRRAGPARFERPASGRFHKACVQGQKCPRPDKTFPACKNKYEFRNFVEMSFPQKTAPRGNPVCFQMRSAAAPRCVRLAHAPQLEVGKYFAVFSRSPRHVKNFPKAGKLGNKEQRKNREREGQKGGGKAKIKSAYNIRITFFHIRRLMGIF
jgi:hypothetical protein